MLNEGGRGSGWEKKKKELIVAVLNADSPQIQEKSWHRVYAEGNVKSKRKKKALSSILQQHSDHFWWGGKLLRSGVVNNLTWSGVFHYETISDVIYRENDVVSWYHACFTASKMEFCAEKCSESIITEPKCITGSDSTLISVHSSVLGISRVKREHILDGIRYARLSC